MSTLAATDSSTHADTEDTMDKVNAALSKVNFSTSHEYTADDSIHNDGNLYANITNGELRSRLGRLSSLSHSLSEDQYSVELYISLSDIYVKLGYPDLAVGAAYKALLLIDAIEDDCDEYYDSAFQSLSDHIASQPIAIRHEIASNEPDVLSKLEFHNDTDSEEQTIDEEEVVNWARHRCASLVYHTLAQNLYFIGCWQSSYKYCTMGLRATPDDSNLLSVRELVRDAVKAHYDSAGEPVAASEDWPDTGYVRRECYPWNDIEPDRCSPSSLAALNAEMAKVAPKFEVRATELPNLTPSGSKSTPILQLGVFATQDISPGEIVLQETSLLTATNRLNDTLCDACNADLPSLSTNSTVTSCPECSVVFCSQSCHDLALSLYHPAVCDRPVSATARDVPPAQAVTALYLLLLLRSLAMAETQNLHPLDLKEVKYIWGDYHFTPLSAWTAPTATVEGAFASLPRTLPWDFENNVVAPLTLLTKMDIDIFAEVDRFDTWVFNTLYAKFRGTASARLSGGEAGARVRGPDVSAVHPMWCLVNHSCDPHLRWEWGGEVVFVVRDERVEWKGGRRSKAGIKKGEEVLNHYCDVDLGVKERREWAAGSLGGDCLCERCLSEAGEI